VVDHAGHADYADRAQYVTAGGSAYSSGLPLSIQESARTAGAWAWAELSLFEIVGAWVPSARRPSAKIYFDACSQHHAWRAQMWQQVLPAQPLPAASSPGPVDKTTPEPSAGHPAEFVKPFSDGALVAMQMLGELEGDVALLGAYCRVVLPRLIVGYRSWLQRCSSSSDRSVARALGFALADTTNDWERGSAVMLRYLDGPRGPEGVVSAAGASSEVERLLVGQGLVPGG
jgi:hypothetical protein